VKFRTAQAFAPLVLASFLAYTPAALALVGGPFDNGHSIGATAAGTYAGVIRGINLTGLVQFGISDSSESNGRFAVFHEGIMSYGVCEAIADPTFKTIAGVLLGVTALPAETTGASANITGTTALQAITVRGSAEGAWDAQMKGFPIAITFEGKGTLATVANPTTVTTAATGDSVVITSPGTADDGISGGTNTQTVTATATTTVQGTQLRGTTPFQIRGSRTSLQTYNPINSFAAVPPRVPTTPSGTTGSPTP
jgi:hypothetical protein